MGSWHTEDISFDRSGRMLVHNQALFEALRNNFNRLGKVVIKQDILKPDPRPEIPDPDGGGPVGPDGGPLPPFPFPRPTPEPDPGPLPDTMCVCTLRLDTLNGWPLEMWTPDFKDIRHLGPPHPHSLTPPSGGGTV